MSDKKRREPRSQKLGKQREKALKRYKDRVKSSTAKERFLRKVKTIRKMIDSTWERWKSKGLGALQAQVLDHLNYVVDESKRLEKVCMGLPEQVFGTRSAKMDTGSLVRLRTTSATGRERPELLSKTFKIIRLDEEVCEIQHRRIRLTVGLGEVRWERVL